MEVLWPAELPGRGGSHSSDAVEAGEPLSDPVGFRVDTPRWGCEDATVTRPGTNGRADSRALSGGSRLLRSRSVSEAACAVFVLTSLLGALSVADARKVGGSGQAPPNVLVVMTDDETVADMRVLPRIQKLIGDQGTTFTNNFVNYSLCCPSRATFLTGQYAHNHGVLFGSAFTSLDSSNTLPVWLQDSGYHTGHIGKYLGGYGRPNAGGPGYVPPGWTEWYASDPPALDVYDYDLNENGDVVHHGSAPSEFKDSVFTRKAVDFIDRNAPSPDPFLLFVAYAAPHVTGSSDRRTPDRARSLPAGCADAAMPAPGDQDAFSTEPLPMPPSFNEADVSDKTGKVAAQKSLTPGLIDDLTRQYRCRLASLLHVDRGVTRMVNAVRRTGELKRTLVIFVSDNGFFSGEHRIPRGKVWPYEESIRVPLMIRGPGVPAGRTVDSFSINADLAPTILDAAGVAPGRIEDGMSLYDLIADPSQQRDLLIENHVETDKYSAYAGVRTARYVYIAYSAGGDELYDLETDPYELENLVSDPSYAAPLAWLQARLAELRDCAGESCRSSVGEPPPPPLVEPLPNE